MTTAINTSAHQRRLANSRWTSPLAIAVCFALVKLLVHLFANRGYGYFRDELYFLACGEHLDWGYVDHAPMVALAAKLSRTLLGDSLSAIRFLPALAGAVKVLLAGLLVREFGGRRFSVMLACLCVLVVPVYLGIDNFLSMNAFEPVFWMGCVYFIVLAINRNDPRYLLGFGALAGLGLQNKHSMLIFGLAFVAGLALTPARRLLADKWLWIAGAIAFVIFLPNIIWEQQHNWATLELLNNVKTSGKNVTLSPLEFIWQQVLFLLPLTAPVWIGSLWFFFFDGQGRRYRLLGVTYVAALLLMILMKGKNYYLAPIYPMLFAGGAVLWEKLLAGRRYGAWLKVAYPVILVASGAVFAPMSLPVLPVETLIRYQHALGFKPSKTEVGHEGVLPQHFGDMFGWPEMVEAVASVYHGLPPEERAKAAVYGGNYGEAGAIDLFGPRYGLPKAISAHQNYFLWGPRDYTGEVMIVLQAEREELEQGCASVEEGPRLNHPYAMTEEHYAIFICRGLKRPLPQLWPSLKHWN
ncbi:MAG: glycosyltransferase family 39 protein [Pyrinomonadaceae bacterium]